MYTREYIYEYTIIYSCTHDISYVDFLNLFVRAKYSTQVQARPLNLFYSNGIKKSSLFGSPLCLLCVLREMLLSTRGRRKYQESGLNMYVYFLTPCD